MNQSINIALVGASGVVGSKIIQLLEKKAVSINNFYPLGSSSVGQEVYLNGIKYPINNTENFNPSSAQLTIFAAG